MDFRGFFPFYVEIPYKKAMRSLILTIVILNIYRHDYCDFSLKLIERRINMQKRSISLFFSILVLFIVTPAGAVLIDFDGLTPGSVIDGLDLGGIVINSYQGRIRV